MTNWHLAPSLVRFRVWNRAKWPNQNNAGDGSIGDASHAARKSDHNPNVRRSVNAIDEDERGIHMPTLMVAFMMHPSARYVIYERDIWHVNRSWRCETYTGDNPHDKHGHFSIHQTVKAEQSKTEFGVTAWPTLINGSTGRAVSELQAYLNVYNSDSKVGQLYVDGHFGDKTEAAVKAYQARFSVAGGVDGVVGVHTEYSLKSNPNYH